MALILCIIVLPSVIWTGWNWAWQILVCGCLPRSGQEVCQEPPWFCWRKGYIYSSQVRNACPALQKGTSLYIGIQLWWYCWKLNVITNKSYHQFGKITKHFSKCIKNPSYSCSQFHSIILVSRDVARTQISWLRNINLRNP